MATDLSQFTVPSDRFDVAQDNAAKLDSVVNGPSAVVTTRTGKGIQSLDKIIESIAAITDRGAWAPATSYQVKDLVVDTGTFYIAVNAHTSGATFAGDVANWRVYQGVIQSQGDLRYGTTFATVAAMVAVNPEALDSEVVDIVADMRLSTPGYYDGWAAFVEPQGAGDYIAATLASVRTARSDGGWVPDELINHTLDNGLVAMLQFSDVLDVKQAGAVADGVADDFLSIIAALTEMLDSGRRGTAFLSSGTYRSTGIIAVGGAGVKLGGAGSRSSVLVADHILGPAIRVFNEFSGVSGMRIDSSATRLSGGGTGDYGILVQSDPLTDLRPSNGKYKDIVVEEQPDTGMLVIGGAWGSEYEHILIKDSQGHGIQFDDGTLVSHTKLENPGISTLRDVNSTGCLGHGLVIGGANGGTNRGFRFIVDNCEYAYNAATAGRRFTVHQAWVFADTSIFTACAVDGLNPAQDTLTTNGIHVAGRQIEFKNTRTNNILGQSFTIAEVAAFQTRGITIDEIFISGALSVALDPAVTIDPNAIECSVRSSSLTFITALVDTITLTPRRRNITTAVKDSTQIVNNSITLVNDTDLKLLLGNKERSYFKAVIYYRGSSTADIQFAFIAPSGASILYAPSGSLRIGAGDVSQIFNVTFNNTSIGYGCATGNNTRMAVIEGEVRTTGTAGDLTMQWAQISAEVSNTEVLGSSYLEITR
jgi:hypothetical protein